MSRSPVSIAIEAKVVVPLDVQCLQAKRRLARFITSRAEAAHADIARAFSQLRRDRRLPPYVISGSRWLKLPSRFECPECGGRLLLEVDEWSTSTGIPTPGGIRVMCEAEEEELARSTRRDADPDWQHRNWQSDWQPVHDQVERWAATRVRVVPGERPVEVHGRAT